MRKPMYGVSVPTPRDPTPSPEDVRVTEQIVGAGKLLDIDVLDHLIIGQQRFVSLKERGLGFA
jgi:DNA repair protein RadC